MSVNEFLHPIDRGDQGRVKHLGTGEFRLQRELDKVSLPLVDRTIRQYEELMERGYGDEDISALYRLKRP